MIGLSGINVSKLLMIERENDEFIDLIDKDILTIHQAYIQVSGVRRKRNLEKKTGRMDLIQEIQVSDSSINVLLKWMK